MKKKNLKSFYDTLIVVILTFLIIYGIFLIYANLRSNNIKALEKKHILLLVESQKLIFHLIDINEALRNKKAIPKEKQKLIIENIQSLKNKLSELGYTKRLKELEAIDINKLFYGDAKSLKKLFDVTKAIDQDTLKVILKKDFPLFKWFSAIFTAIFVLIISIGIISLRKYFISYHHSIQNAISQIKEILEFKLKVPKNYKFGIKSDWEEEKELLESIKAINEEISITRELIDLPIYGILEDTLPVIFNSIRTYVPADRLAVAFIDRFGDVVAETAVSTSKNIRLRAGFRDSLANTTLYNVIKTKQPRIINDLEYYYNNVHKSKATKLLLEEGMRSSITAPLMFGERCVGFMFVNNKNKNVYTQTHKARMERVVFMIKGVIYNSYLNQGIIASSSRAFAELVESRDYETGNHLKRVSRYAYTIAQELAETEPNLKIAPKFVREIFWFAPLHDIGKVGIPDDILNKKGKLTKKEFEIMKKHVIIGERVLKNMDEYINNILGQSYLSTAIDIVSGHHEKWDGTGYPRGLKGEQIPLAGRIVAVADVFDALTTKRPYKPPFGFDKSVKIIKELSGSHFDPKVVDVFLRKLAKIYRIYRNYKDTK